MRCTPRGLALAGVLLAAAAIRFLPLPPNSAPVGAMALFGGAMLARWRAALALPLGAMLLSDLLMAWLFYGPAVFPGMPFVYAGFAFYVVLGRWMRRRRCRGPFGIGSAALAGSLGFFLITNFGVWLRGTLYPLSFEGLLACYTAGLPFYRNTVAADVIFSALFFGGLALAARYWPILREPARGRAEPA